MKTLLTTSALVAFAAMPAFAQTATDTTTVPAADASGAFMTSGGDVSADASASTLIGKRIYTSNAPVSEEDGVMEVSDQWEDIGEVGDILLSRDGQVEAVVLDIGGFLGIGEKHVAIKMDQVHMVNDTDANNDYFLVVNLDRATIESAPEFDMASVGAWAAAAAQTAGNAADATGQAIDNAATNIGNAADNAATNIDNAADNVATDTETLAENAGEQADQTTEQTQAMVQDPAAGTDTTVVATDTTTATAPAGQLTTDAAGTTDTAADTTATVPEGSTDTTAMSTAPADTTQTAQDTTTVGTTTTEPAANTTVVADNPNPGAPNLQREGWTTAAVGDLTTADLEGARLYDVNDEMIGEVSKLIIDENGKITQAVLDVGGFLGIGEKSVALPMDELQIQRADQGGELRVYVNTTQDDLESMQEYDEKG